MKHILITGKNSYIGNKFEEWVTSFRGNYSITKISVRDDKWKDMDWSKYDVLLHVAGIVHNSTKESSDIYYAVNSNLTFSIAQKAKQDGVTHLIYMSTMSVYGENKGEINKDTPLKPYNIYGKSKLKGEELILELQDKNFIISIIRPPMIYGKDSPGNYSKLAMVARRTPVFPNIENNRSMLYIENLSEFLRCVIDYQKDGILFPQNSEYINTSQLVKMIAHANNNNILMVKIFNRLFNSLNLNIIDKIFGTLIYSQDLSKYEFEYNIFPFEESIYLSERKDDK